MRASSRDYATIALNRCPFELDDGSFSNSHHPSSEGTFPVGTPKPGLNDRWIEAKCRRLLGDVVIAGWLGLALAGCTVSGLVLLLLDHHEDDARTVLGQNLARLADLLRNVDLLAGQFHCLAELHL